MKRISYRYINKNMYGIYVWFNKNLISLECWINVEFGYKKIVQEDNELSKFYLRSKIN